MPPIWMRQYSDLQGKRWFWRENFVVEIQLMLMENGMLFNSYVFVLCFLPICIIGYFILNRVKQRKLAQIFLLMMSLWFYGFFDFHYLLIIIFSIVVNYCIYQLVLKEINRHILLALALLFNLGMLFYFKYLSTK